MRSWGCAGKQLTVRLNAQGSMPADVYCSLFILTRDTCHVPRNRLYAGPGPTVARRRSHSQRTHSVSRIRTVQAPTTLCCASTTGGAAGSAVVRRIWTRTVQPLSGFGPSRRDGLPAEYSAFRPAFILGLVCPVLPGAPACSSGVSSASRRWLRAAAAPACGGLDALEAVGEPFASGAGRGRPSSDK